MEKQIRQVTFDTNSEKIGVTTPFGFAIFDSETMLLLKNPRFQVGGGEQISLLSDSNLVAVSGDGANGGVPKSTLLLWDINTDQIFRQIDHSTIIVDVFLTRDVLIVVRLDNISFYNTADFALIQNVQAPVKSKGIVSIVTTFANSYIVLPSNDGQCLCICDFHDPSHVLGKIPIASSKVSMTAFDREGNLLAIAADDGKIVQLWSVRHQKHITSYRRGVFGTEVICIAFDNLSNYFLMTSKRGTMHIFAIPTPSEAKQYAEQELRSKYTLNLKKEIVYYCQFDISGYIINGITGTGMMKKIRLDLEKNEIVPVGEKVLDIK